LLLSSVVGTIFFPLFSSLIAKNDWETVNKKIITFQEIVILFIFPFACLMAIIGEPFLVTLLGIRYERSVIPFIILLFSTFVSIVGMPYGNILSGMGRFYLGAWINFIALVIFFISITFFLSPRFLHLGATGLALNTLVMALVNNLLYLFFARKYGTLTFSRTNGLRYILILLISGIVFFLVRYISTWGSFWWIIMIPCYLILMYGFLIVTGLLKHRHWMLLISVINIKKTTSYIEQEFKIKKVDTL
jgi:O-antigen/teichoic acid export membrane protein